MFIFPEKLYFHGMKLDLNHVQIVKLILLDKFI